jgi:hypothetical protein
MRTATFALGLAFAAGSLDAQARPALGAMVEVGFLRLRSELSAPGTLSGPALGGEGRVSWGILTLGAAYLGGRLTGSGGTPLERDLSTGEVFLGVAPSPWLELSIGPAVRSYVTDAGTERWVWWRARARVQAALAGPSVGTYIEVWRSVSSEVNVATPPDRAQGGEVGLIYRVPRRPLRLQFGYRIDDTTLKAGGGETLEVIRVAARIGSE